MFFVIEKDHGTFHKEYERSVNLSWFHYNLETQYKTKKLNCLIWNLQIKIRNKNGTEVNVSSNIIGDFDDEIHFSCKLLLAVI